MTNFLIRLFIGKDKDVTRPEIRGKYASLSGFTGITVNVLLFIGKLILGIIAGSLAIIADAFNNIMDAGSSIVTLIGFRMAGKPVDKEHPLGHGRIEYVTAFIVDVLIILVGFELFTSSIDKIVDKNVPNVGDVTLILLSVAILVKLWLFSFYRKIGNTISSAAIKGAAFDSLSDCIATMLVLVSAIVARVSNVGIDGWAGILVAAFILFTGIKAAKETIDLLLGSPPSKEFIDDIYAFSKRYASVIGIHDVMVHDYGPGRQIVSFHAEVPADSDINIAHEEVDQMERDMHEAFGCIVTVHLDPVVTNDPFVDEMRNLAAEAAKAVDETFSIHDFRMTDGQTHINLIFDVVVPLNDKTPHEELQNIILTKLREINPLFNIVIKIEHSYV